MTSARRGGGSPVEKSSCAISSRPGSIASRGASTGGSGDPMRSTPTENDTAETAAFWQQPSLQQLSPAWSLGDPELESDPAPSGRDAPSQHDEQQPECAVTAGSGEIACASMRFSQQQSDIQAARAQTRRRSTVPRRATSPSILA